MRSELLPTVLRGAALSDLPSPASVAALRLPTLLLAWTEDPTHPIGSAHRLHSLIDGSELVVATSPADVETWPARFARHLQSCDGVALMP